MLSASCTGGSAGLELSVTCTVKLKAPPCPLTVPEISPLLLRLRPPGSEPETIVQVYGAWPPAARRNSSYLPPSTAAGSGPVAAIRWDDATGGCVLPVSAAWETETVVMSAPGSNPSGCELSVLKKRSVT